MKFSQQRYQEAQQYDRLFYQEIYDRIPNISNITTLESVKDNNGEYGVRDIVTLNDYMHNIDAIAISDDKDITRFQFKTTRTSTIWFDVITARYDKFRFIKGSYIDADNVYFISCGDADIIAFYMITLDKMFFFDASTVRNIFRYEDAWQQGSIERSKNGCSYIRIELDKFMDIYKKYSDFFLYGSYKKEDESEGYTDKIPEDSNING